jgi:hypothetical protein
MNKSLSFIAAALACVSTLGHAQSASAPAGAASRAEWSKEHPRRAEVNARLAHQNKRIHDEVAEGEMSPARAAKLRSEDRAIRQQERAMAAEHGGHITKAEQVKLNKEENAVSRQIGK